MCLKCRYHYYCSAHTCQFFCVQVCLAAVGLVGDLCRVLSAKIEPSCRELLEAMVVALVVSFFVLLAIAG